MGRYAQSIIAVVLLCIGQSAVAQVDIYRWVDSDGVVHFSDTRRSAADEHFELLAYEPSAEAVESHRLLMDQQLELIALLEESRRSRAEQILDYQRQNVELARARLALQQERNATATAPLGTGSYGYVYPVPYVYGYARRDGYRERHGFGYGFGPARGYPGYRPGRPWHGYGGGGPIGHPPVGPGHDGGRGVLSKPFITDR